MARDADEAEGAERRCSGSCPVQIIDPLGGVDFLLLECWIGGVDPLLVASDDILFAFALVVVDLVTVVVVVDFCPFSDEGETDDDDAAVVSGSPIWLQV